MAKYLYGASIQGIQQFIFKTNKLKEIAGASALVDNICKEDFFDFAGVKKDDENVLMATSGNIKFICDEEQCRRLVRTFPKYVASKAPGITLSQAVVKLSEDATNVQEDINKLERKLKAQRNKVSFPFETGFMALERSRRTGGVGVDYNRDGKVIDKATSLKIEKEKEDTTLFVSFSGDKNVTKKNIPLEIDKMVVKDRNSWVAVMHADGNGLGKLIHKMSTEIKADYAKTFRLFSKKLEEATQKSANEAFEAVVEKGKNDVYPVRPILLGGDDLTIVIRADLALEFTTAYLKAFEKNTAIELDFLKDKGIEVEKLTACAGIAYIKSSYPFHYGADLAEGLCKKAKKMSKDKDVFKDSIPSSLAFYKVQDSFIDDIEALTQRTLSIASAAFDNGTNSENKDKGVFDNGPYLVNKEDAVGSTPYVNQLDQKLAVLKKYAKKDGKGVSKLRQWISELYNNKENADLMMDRMKEVNSSFYKEMGLEEERRKKQTILYDVLLQQSFDY